MKSRKISSIAIFCIVLCIFAVSTLSAKSYLPEVGQEEFYIDEVYYLNSAFVNADMLQFMQVYMAPEDPVTFYQTAANWTDEEIETNGYYYLSFIFPEIAGQIPFFYYADLEAFCFETNQDPGQGPFAVYENITTFEDLRAIFPSGIVRCNAYDMVRTTARQLAFYCQVVSEDGLAPSAEFTAELINYIFEQIEAEFNAAMEAEAQLAEVAPAEETVAL